MIAKAASKKIGALFHSMKFLSPEIVLYLYKSTIRPCIEYCCHVWAGAPKCYLDLLDKLQKHICRVVGFDLSSSLQSLAHHRNVVSLSLFYRYYFGWCSDELAELVPLPHACGHATRCSIIGCMLLLLLLDITRKSMPIESFHEQLSFGIHCLQSASL